MTPFDRFRAVRDDASLGAIEKLVLYTLASRGDRDGRSWPSYDRLAKDCGLSRSTIIRTIRTLVEKGALRCEKRRDETGDATSNAYVISIGGVVARDDYVVSHGDQVVAQGHYPSSARTPRVVSHGDHGGVSLTPEVDQGRAHLKKTSEASSLTLPIGDSGMGVKTESETATSSRPSRQPGRRATKSEKPIPDGYHDLIHRFVAVFAEKKGEQPSKATMGRNGKAAKAILEAHSIHEAISMLERAFADPWVVANQPNLWHVAQNADKYRGGASSPNGRPMQPAPDDSPWLRLPDS